ncbi:MAG TPA: methylenetetrahydrofolate--tRNA-(uracil(54)-C(5))-methyltransferase (FADH(2)-oxidizing) TrmFO [Thermodesulfovibrionales bacterium]|nr:methylenetetrahydrofolate--tRNA-(uracil(54)-C(5))-methyltransferase (FADH(2)-oxidizing) TrmFO [Thermodesulfovibrionales bacterium]
MEELIIIGGGLAGSEAAWQAAMRGVKVTLCEMRPARTTEAHKTAFLAELVCSNSFRSSEPLSAPGLLKRELQAAGSLIMKAAEVSRVPAGTALAVNRELFSGFITNAISSSPGITVARKEIEEIPDTCAIIATGPLTSPSMTEALRRLIGQNYLFFYDAIAPIVSADSIDREKVYFASRYGKGGDDYINCPMSEKEYTAFHKAVLDADKVGVRDFEDSKVFEGCMPVEVMALRGRDTLRFGPMKPVGLSDPKTGREPYAVVQLRPENNEKTAYNMVGFQTRLTWPAQKEVFSLIPGLEGAEFLRLGSLHRNTFINSPLLLGKDLSLRMRESVFIAGQITGVEGYLESTAMGLVAGINAARRIQGKESVAVPVTTAHGSLMRHITSPVREFQPTNINFGLFPSLGPEQAGIRDKKLKKKAIVERAGEDWEGYVKRVGQ